MMRTFPAAAVVITVSLAAVSAAKAQTVNLWSVEWTESNKWAIGPIAARHARTAASRRANRAPDQ